MTAKRLSTEPRQKTLKGGYMLFGANDYTAEEIQELFSDMVEQETPPADDTTTPTKTSKPNDTKGEKPNVTEGENVDTTKAFAKRLKESTDKARAEERDAIAKSLGYESYADMQSARDKKLIEEKGLDPNEVAPIVEELVKKRIDDDPRMKELSELRKQKLKEFKDKELAEISKLTNGQISKLEQVPKDVLELWKTDGSLKSAYLKLHGEELILKARSEQNKGSTDHLNIPTGTTIPTGQRLLTAEEKRVYKMFNPKITDEELNKKTTAK